MEFSVNLNERFTAKLTKEGAEAVNKYHKQCIDEYLKLCPNADVNFLKTDYAEGDEVSDSLWRLFSMLGDYFQHETSAPFENNELNFFSK